MRPFGEATLEFGRYLIETDLCKKCQSYEERYCSLHDFWLSIDSQKDNVLFWEKREDIGNSDKLWTARCLGFRTK